MTDNPAASAARIDCLPDLGRRTLIMGILNVTPDSFSDGGLFASFEAASAHAVELVAEGADILDIGGESTRPGHTAVPAEEEMARVLPVLRQAVASVAAPISIDTYKAVTARAAFEAGARILNDVWGLQREPEIARVAADFAAPVIAMHNRETVDGSLDIVEEMKAFFDRTLAIARAAGIPDGRIVLDPGIGFGKTFEQNLDALRRLGDLKRLGFPLLVGTSRKSLIGKLLDKTPRERINGTIASNVMAIANGADIIRVHDVLAHREAARIADAIMGKDIMGKATTGTAITGTAITGTER
ncbi:dihydropteroate synthase [Prosthecomicrobium hirschii]|uniref:Dihydropteroate synthase n=1 Tax=Prosthecodimorpha hirschii TaxID=665126 RepID=A0A0P6VYE9_9HYPH|nr:dihydropteroate synthase [Prosthecomicrobium hirschii]